MASTELTTLTQSLIRISDSLSCLNVLMNNVTWIILLNTSHTSLHDLHNYAGSDSLKMRIMEISSELAAILICSMNKNILMHKSGCSIHTWKPLNNLILNNKCFFLSDYRLWTKTCNTGNHSRWLGSTVSYFDPCVSNRRHTETIVQYPPESVLRSFGSNISLLCVPNLSIYLNSVQASL